MNKLTYSVAHQWSLYASDVLPAGASSEARRDLRRAFYAGAAAMMRVLHQMGDSGMDDDEGARQIDQLQFELSKFKTDVANGSA